LAEILRYWPLSEDRHNAICQAHERFEVVKFLQEEPFIIARIRIVPAKERITKPIAARFRALKDRAREVLELAPGAPEDLAEAVEGIESPTQMADLVATFMDAPAAAKQDLLETFDLKQRLDKLMHILGELEEVLRLSNKIRQDTRGNLDQAQREYFLREQLRAIRRELGEDEDSDSDLDDLAARAKALSLPEEARKRVERDLRRLARTPEQSAEHPMLRTWLETVLELPWGQTTEARVDLRRAARILDEEGQAAHS
jgi:ATP-dependent Lon protease